MEDRSGDVTSESLSTPASDQRQTSSINVIDDQLNESDDSGASEVDETGTGRGNSKKKPRGTHACQACRRMKIRCELLEDRDSCKQCAKVNRECLVTEPRRKRQKTVHRVTELEKKIDALTASLNAKNVSDSRAFTSSSLPDVREADHTDKAAEMNSDLRKEYLAARGTDNSGLRVMTAEQQPYVDVIDRGIIDEETAYKSFQRYHTEMCKFFPLVVFPPTMTAYEVRTTKPTLFLALLTGAVGIFRPEVQPILCDELSMLIADKIFYRAERSFELVQTLILYVVNYSRPKHQTELNFNQIIHVAATMALDIGLGRRSKGGVFNENSPIPGVTVVEIRRTWLAIYYMCANAATSLRHPIFIRWSPYVEESIDYLNNSPDALKSDAWLCELIKIQHIADEVAFVFSMDDPAFTVSLSDTKTQYHIKTFERQLQQWRQNSKADVNMPWARHLEASINLYIHEIAIHFDHNVDDFRPPPLMTDERPTGHDEMITPAHIDSLMICIDSIHVMFDAYFEMDIDTIRNLPNLFMVRNAYAAVALIKMDGVFKSRGSKFEMVFSPNLKVESYLNTLIDVLDKANEGSKSIIAFGFGFVFRRLKQWYLTRQGPPEENCRDLAKPPMKGPFTGLGYEQLRGKPDDPPTDSNSKLSNPNAGCEQLFAATSLSLPQQEYFAATTPNDSTMFGLGLPQFYDFGFTFDDMGLTDGTGQTDPGWYPFSMTQM